VSSGDPFRKSGFPRKHKFSGNRKITYFCCAAGKTTGSPFFCQENISVYYASPKR